MTTRGLVGAALLLLAAGQAEAAWNNAFQVCCHGSRNRASYYYAPAPVVAYSAPSPCCSTSYVQRCYYQPVTSYKTVMQPVTSYRTSYYWEPVCSYRSSCYQDPCTGASVQVTQPVTSYRLRSQCNAVTSYVQRCVPVTSYRPTYYLEAVTNCPPPCPTPCATPGVAESPSGNPNLVPPTNVPNVEEAPASPGAPGSFRQPPRPGAPVPASQPFPARFDRVTARPANPGAMVRGQVVANNYVTPLRGAKVLFVSRESKDSQQGTQADFTGRFNVNLPAGGWNIYVSQPNGKLEYHSSIDVLDAQNRNVTVVSR